MHYICHRVNRVHDLLSIPTQFGVEIDLRNALDGRIHLEHEPFCRGEDFEEYLRHYHHGTLILNVKSERIEEKILELLDLAGVEDFFFLDCTFPMMISLSGQGIRKLALRFSEWEGMETLRLMEGRAEWVWVDCFTRCPLNSDNYLALKTMGYRVCIVSPELQGRQSDVEAYAQYLQTNHLIPDAVCTKQYNIPLWQSYFSKEG